MDFKNGPLKFMIWIVYAIGAAGMGYFLWSHKAHLGQYIPYLFLLLCPLMHFFGGHGDHGKECHHKKEKE